MYSICLHHDYVDLSKELLMLTATTEIHLSRHSVKHKKISSNSLTYDIMAFYFVKILSFNKNMKLY